MSEDNVVDYCFRHNEQVPCNRCIVDDLREILRIDSVPISQEFSKWREALVRYMRKYLFGGDATSDHNTTPSMEATTQNAFLSMGTAHSNTPDTAFIPATGTFLAIPASVCEQWLCRPENSTIYLYDIWVTPYIRRYEQ